MKTWSQLDTEQMENAIQIRTKELIEIAKQGSTLNLEGKNLRSLNNLVEEYGNCGNEVDFYQSFRNDEELMGDIIEIALDDVEKYIYLDDNDSRAVHWKI